MSELWKVLWKRISVLLARESFGFVDFLMSNVPEHGNAWLGVREWQIPKGFAREVVMYISPKKKITTNPVVRLRKSFSPKKPFGEKCRLSSLPPGLPDCQTKNPKLGKFWRVLLWKILV
jgi:hypothetical protein